MPLSNEQKQKLAETEKRARAALREVAKVKRGSGGAPKQYETHRERMAARAAELSESGRDIGALPKVVNPKRKAACSTSFRAFCETYFPATFGLAWSADHLKVIAAIEAAVTKGGLFAFAMPRGSG